MKERDDLAFPLAEYRRRLDAVRERIARAGIHALLVTTPENICYLTGFESPGHYAFCALLVPTEGEPVMIPRLLEQSGVDARTWIELSHPYLDDEDPMDRVRGVLRQYGFAGLRIGYERDGWFFTASQQDRLFARLGSTQFYDVSGVVEGERLVKSEPEIEMIREAARYAEAGMQGGLDAIADGVTENEVAAAIHDAMFRAGGEWPAISPFVASGHRGSIGHATWERHRITDGMLVFLEVGGCLKRYHAATMRTAYVGDPPAEIRGVAEAVIEAQEASIAAIRPGMTLGEVDAVSRDMLATACERFGCTQMTRSAYSIGIAFPPDWGEGHIMSIRHEDPRTLQPNMTFHNIPWVQLPGVGGMGFSETIRVTEDGCETLTNLQRKLWLA